MIRGGVLDNLGIIDPVSIGLGGDRSSGGGRGLKAATWGTIKVKSSWALDGLLDAGATKGTILEGVERGDPKDFGVPDLVGVGRRGSFSPGRVVLGIVRLGEELIVFGVTAFGLGLLGGLECSVEGWSWPLIEYGPAVAGRAVISGLLFPGLMGAPEIPPVMEL